MAIGDHIIISYLPARAIIFKCTFQTRLWDFECDISIDIPEIEAHDDTDQEAMFMFILLCKIIVSHLKSYNRWAILMCWSERVNHK